MKSFIYLSNCILLFFSCGSICCIVLSNFAFYVFTKNFCSLQHKFSSSSFLLPSSSVLSKILKYRIFAFHSRMPLRMLFMILHWINQLKHSQYKNDATQLKNFLRLKLPPFFLHRVGDVKRRQIQNQEVFQLNCVVPIMTAL